MKSFIVLLASFASVNAMALAPNSTWSQIFADRTATVQVNFASLSGISLDNACLRNDTVETIRAVPVCVTTVAVEVKEPQEGTYTEYHCTQYSTQKIVAPRTYQHSYCEVAIPAGEQQPRPELCEHKTVTITTPATVKAVVLVNYGQMTTSFEKDFTFPACN